MISPEKSDATSKRLRINRRQFLRGSMAVAAMTPIIGAAMTQAAELDGPKNTRKVKLGVVGCGGRGAWIAGLFKKHGGYEMHAVADYFQPVADACGDALGVDKTRRFSGLSGFKKVIESGVEAVALETPPFWFPEHVRAAVAAGLHVYMAKPIAVDVPGCLDVDASAKSVAGKRCFLVDYQMPTDPSNIEVVKMIHGGEIGKVATINSQYFSSLFADPPKTANLESRLRSLIWCNDVAVGGGYHVNACIHAIEAAMWIAGGVPVSATGMSRLMRPDPHGDSHDVFSMLFEFENGLIVNHRGKHLNNQTGFDVFCQAQGQSGFAQIPYGGKAFLRAQENGFNGEVPNLYEAGAVRNIATFYKNVVAEDYSNATVRRAVDSALATILGREACLRRAQVTMAQLIQENKRLSVDLTGLKT